MMCRKYRQLAFAATVAATAGFALPAGAADVHRQGGSYKDAPEVYVAPRNWDGFYLGVHGGYAWGDFEASDVDFALDLLIDEDIGHDPDGYVFGIQIGYNWQRNSPWVFGIEADIAGTTVDGGATYDLPLFGGTFTDEQSMDMDYFATIRARLGYDLGRTLIFVTGGWAVAKVDANFDTSFFVPPGPAIGLEAGDDSTHGGWVIGGGFETWVSESISLKADYLYADMDEEIYQPVSTVPGEPFEFTVQMVRVGLNFHF